MSNQLNNEYENGFIKTIGPLDDYCALALIKRDHRHRSIQFSSDDFA